MKVKRIIEIDEDALKFVQELTEIIIPARSGKTLQKNVIEAIKFSKPYNPTGDCISREALKEQINATDFDFGDYYDNTEEIRKRVCETIDNAPTVVVDCKNCDGYEAGYSAGVRDTERPKGECRTCKHRDPEDKKCDCGGLERQGCPFPVSDDYFCKFYEKGGAEE